MGTFSSNFQSDPSFFVSEIGINSFLMKLNSSLMFHITYNVLEVSFNLAIGKYFGFERYFSEQ